jgi:AmiR/NasT family two-component response regulator
MGGFAIAMDVALEAGAGRLSPTPVLVLLDRRADVFLARRTGVAGWLVKPLDPLRVRDAVAVVLAGERYEDTAFVSLPTDLGPGDEI